MMPCRHPRVLARFSGFLVNLAVLTRSVSKAAIGSDPSLASRLTTQRGSRIMSTVRNAGFGRRLFLRMTTALCAAIGLPGLGLAAASVGSVTKVRGQARVVRAGGNVMLAEGTPIESGDGVVTG